MINLGYLKHNDLFEFDGEKYRVGHADGNGWVTCTNIATRKIKKIHIDSPVEKLKEQKNE